MLRYTPLLALAACATPHSAEPVEVFTTAVAVDAFGDATCALDGNGVPVCVGAEPPRLTDSQGAQTPLALPAPATVVAVGVDHACALLVDGEIACWGDNHGGRLTNSYDGCPVSTTPDAQGACTLAPTIIADLRATAIDAGDDVTCALTDAGEIACWGDAAGGALGHDQVGVFPPTALEVDGAPIHATALSLASRRGCAVTTDHALVCWGGAWGAPTRVDDVGQVAAVAVGDDHACAVDLAGGVRCWGENRNGQAGDLGIASKCGRQAGPCTIGPTLVEGIGPAIDVAVGARHSCARLRDRTIACWGDNEWGQLGRNDAFLVGAPGIAPIGGAAALATGRAHTCVRTDDAEGWCFGLDDVGQIGGAP